MKSVVDVKGLGDIRTAISTRSRSASRHKGTPYLEIMSLGMQKLRLSSEQERLAERVERVDARLGELRCALQERLTMVAEESPAGSNPQPRPAGIPRSTEQGPARSRPWKTMAVEY
ncbi:MAG: hypothetical protein Q7K03_10985 [Dehalococcoidia bacterium]|nr:hypothetical protein [Dehalococcoidia bacterium]